MIRSFAAILALILSIPACGSDTVSDRVGTETATQQAPQTTESQREAPAEPTSAQQPETEQAATASQESASQPAAEGRDDSTVQRLAAAPAAQPLSSGRWKVGTHYTTITPPQQTTAGAGKVEVLEFFWYGCSHCYALEPFLESWKKTKPEHIELVQIPVMWGALHQSHARLFYTLEALGRSDLHDEVFTAIHREGNMLIGNSEARARALQAEFAKANGIAEDTFLNAYNSFGVNSSLQRAEQLTRRYRVQGVPYIVVNGKYATDVGMAGGQSNLIALINDLAASEKRP